MRKGKHKLYVWPGVEADGKNETSTPSRLKTTSELDRLERLVKKHDTGDIQPVDWLDALAFRQIEKIHKVYRVNTSSHTARFPCQAHKYR